MKRNIEGELLRCDEFLADVLIRDPTRRLSDEVLHKFLLELPTTRNTALLHAIEPAEEANAEKLRAQEAHESGNNHRWRKYPTKRLLTREVADYVTNLITAEKKYYWILDRISCSIIENSLKEYGRTSGEREHVVFTVLSDYIFLHADPEPRGLSMSVQIANVLSTGADTRKVEYLLKITEEVGILLHGGWMHFTKRICPLYFEKDNSNTVMRIFRRLRSFKRCDAPANFLGWAFLHKDENTVDFIEDFICERDAPIEMEELEVLLKGHAEAGNLKDVARILIREGRLPLMQKLIAETKFTVGSFEESATCMLLAMFQTTLKFVQNCTEVAEGLHEHVNRVESLFRICIAKIVAEKTSPLELHSYLATFHVCVQEIAIELNHRATRSASSNIAKGIIAQNSIPGEILRRIAVAAILAPASKQAAELE